MGTTSGNNSLATFPDENPNPMLRLTLDGGVLYANSAARRLLNDCNSEQDIIPAQWRQLIDSLIENPQNRESEYRCGGRVYSCMFVPVLESGYINVYGVEITGRKRAEDALRNSEEQLRSLIASLDDLVFSVDLDGRFIVYHEAADTSHDTPITPSQLFIGKHYMDVLPSEMAQPLAQTIEQITASLKTEQFEYSLTIDRMPRYFRARVSPLIAPDIRLIGFTVVSSDVTAAKIARQRHQRLLELEQLHRTITAIFLQTDDLNEALDHVLALIGQSLDVSRAYVFNYNNNGMGQNSIHEWCAHDVTPLGEQLPGLRFDEQFPSWLPILSEQGMIAPYNDISELPEDIQIILSQQGVQTLLVLPFYVDSRLQGFVGFDETRYPRQWQPEEIAALRTLSDSYARMLERYNAQRELIRARDAAINSARLKSEFISNISHEIRTPLSQVLGMIDLLFDTNLDEQQEELLGVAQLGARHLLSVVNDILDFSELETGKVDLEIQPFDVRVLIHEIDTVMQPLAHQKQIALMTHVASDVPGKILGDPVRIQQVLTNLVSNGIKFTPSGSVQVQVHQLNRIQDYSMLRFTVIDTGIGIAEEHQQNIFKSFVQGDGSSTRRYGGTGLGLAIAQQLVQLMGSTIVVRSRQGQGSAFEFNLTLRVVD